MQRHARRVDRQPGGEIVAAVEDQVVAGEQAFGIAGVEPLRDRGYGDVRIERLCECRGGRGLGLAGLVFAENQLAVEVRQLDRVVVDDRQPPDAGAGERRQRRAADRARADQRDARRLQFALPRPADLRQDDLPRVALELGIGQFSHRPSPPRRRGSRCFLRVAH